MATRFEIQAVFDRYGVIPAPGTVNAIYQEGRDLQTLERNVQWVHNYLISNPDANADPSGHRLASSTPPVPDPDLSPTEPLPEPEFQVPANAGDLFPFLPDGLLEEFTDAWAELEDPNLALARIRQSPKYDTYFPGIRREDGSLRMQEGEFLTWQEAYESELSNYGVPTSILTTSHRKGLIEGGVDPTQWRNRLATLYSEIGSNITEVRRAYAEQYGVNPQSLSLSSLFASAIDGETSPLVLEQQIRRAQVHGEAMRAGFNTPFAESVRLAEFGLGQEAARSFYTQARTLVPTLGQLADRHNDPDDTFDLNEFSDAVIFQDPDQRERLQRLFGQEASLFTAEALFSVRNGRVEGMQAR